MARGAARSSWPVFSTRVSFTLWCGGGVCVRTSGRDGEARGWTKFPALIVSLRNQPPYLSTLYIGWEVGRLDLPGGCWEVVGMLGGSSPVLPLKPRCVFGLFWIGRLLREMNLPMRLQNMREVGRLGGSCGGELVASKFPPDHP